MTDLARMPLRALVRAEAHKSRVELIITAVDGTELGTLDLFDTRQSFTERRDMALNIARRVNNDSALDLPIEGTSEEHFSSEGESTI